MKHSILLLLSIILLSCSEPTPRKPISRKTTTFLKESIERNKIINTVEEQALLDYILTDSLHKYATSPKGFWYSYVVKDSSNVNFPVRGDEVVYSYEIKDVNNKVIYTKEELGERSYIVDKQELITGLQDGFKLMREGEEMIFLFPSYKTYGYAGYKKIAGNQPLVFTVQLKSIVNVK